MNKLDSRIKIRNFKCGVKCSLKNNESIHVMNIIYIKYKNTKVKTETENSDDSFTQRKPVKLLGEFIGNASFIVYISSFIVYNGSFIAKILP